MKTKKEADFGRFVPPELCFTCNGRGEIKDDYIVGGIFLPSHWTYKKCIDCNGHGKNIFYCLDCDSLLNSKGAGLLWCSNKNCKKFNLVVSLGNKKE